MIAEEILFVVTLGFLSGLSFMLLAAGIVGIYNRTRGHK